MLGAHNATAFASKVDKAEAARRLEAMPNPEVRRMWERVSRAATARTSWPTRAGAWPRGGEDGNAPGGGRRAVALGEEYSLADIKWYSMVPGLPRMVPELCNAEVTPRIVGWLARMGSGRRFWGWRGIEHKGGSPAQRLVIALTFSPVFQRVHSARRIAAKLVAICRPSQQRTNMTGRDVSARLASRQLRKGGRHQFSRAQCVLQ